MPTHRPACPPCRFDAYPVLPTALGPSCTNARCRSHRDNPTLPFLTPTKYRCLHCFGVIHATAFGPTCPCGDTKLPPHTSVPSTHPAPAH
jgi:hypothetical protein